MSDLKISTTGGMLEVAGETVAIAVTGDREGYPAATIISLSDPGFLIVADIEELFLVVDKLRDEMWVRFAADGERSKLEEKVTS